MGPLGVWEVLESNLRGPQDHVTRPMYEFNQTLI